jgi:methylated-DNA-[protein]-cysteine S-methyltransferase
MTALPATAASFALFETPVGPCGIAWGPRGVVGIQLPEGPAAATRKRLLQRIPGSREGTPPAEVQAVLESILALLRGENPDFGAVALDMAGVPPFHRKVYEAARGIPAGETLSYGELAARIGSPGAARAVGQALGNNPFAIVVPCHRVLAAEGRVGGFTANGGITTKLHLLTLESSHAQTQGHFEGDGTFGFDPAAAMEHLRAADPVLGRLFERIGPFRMRLQRTSSIFVSLAQAIVYQQLNGRAAATIFARLRALYPHPHKGPTPEQILRTSDEKLRGAGLSRAKMLSLQDLARRARAGEIPELAEVQGMDNEDVIERLTRVRGIGQWTVEMLLIFRLGRPDVLPVDDFGVRKGYAAAFRKRAMPAPKALAEIGERWKPYRTVVSWYFWRAADAAARKA